MEYWYIMKSMRKVMSKVAASIHLAQGKACSCLALKAGGHS